MRNLLATAVVFAAALASAQNVRIDGIVLNRGGLPAAGASVAVCTEIPITAASEIGSVVTITSTLAPALGSTVSIQGVQPTGYNGLYVVTSTSSTQFTYTNTVTGLATGLTFGSVFIAGSGSASCSPLTPLCSSVTDAGCTSPNPFTSDGLGNYFFYVAPKTLFALQLYGQGLTTRVQSDQLSSTGSSGFGCTTANSPGLPTWNGSQCAVDVLTTDDGNGNFTTQNVVAVQTISGSTVNASNTLNVGGTSGQAASLTFLGNSGTPGNPTANSFTLFGSLVNNSVSCLFGPTGLPCLISSITTQNGGSNLVGHVGPFTINCSTGMSCSDASGVFTLTASVSIIANIQITTPAPASIPANSCTAPTTANMPGVQTTSVFDFTDASNVSTVTGWGGVGGLVIGAFPTLNTLNWMICNQTTSAITPGSSITINVGAH